MRGRKRTGDVYKIVGKGLGVEFEGTVGGRESGHHAIALSWAQKFAESFGKPVELLVQREALFGPVEAVYRVTRDEQGAVWTSEVAGV